MNQIDYYKHSFLWHYAIKMHFNFQQIIIHFQHFLCPHATKFHDIGLVTSLSILRYTHPHTRVACIVFVWFPFQTGELFIYKLQVVYVYFMMLLMRFFNWSIPNNGIFRIETCNLATLKLFSTYLYFQLINFEPLDYKCEHHISDIDQIDINVI